ncbi:MAG: hypothetical protein PHV42_03190 [Candidatus Pacebacteria bacterium]|nr:hypothetical protein [Candidatus Paceibacterota bacterium]
MSWSSKRKFEYAGVAILVILVPVVLAGYGYFHRTPTCFDGSQNGDEQGTDCGGSCLKLCDFQTIPPILRWQRFSRVSAGLYNALAYVENSNQVAGIRSISYLFKLYDEDGVIIAKREGTTYLPPKKISPIFEGAIDTGQRTAVRVTFEFTEDYAWEKYSTKEPNVSLTNKVATSTESVPRLDVRAENLSSARIPHVDFIAVIYDEKGNAMAFSSTAVDKMDPNMPQNLVFTWREPFLSPVSKIEVIPRIDF